MTNSVIVSGVRTPFGKLLGGISGFKASDLGGLVIKEALSRARLAGDQVDYVILGQVLGAGAGQVPARQALLAGGIDPSVAALTINKVCLSGINAVALADQLIRAGEYDVVVAGGQESMSQAPHLLPGSRTGIKYGDGSLVDSMAFDGLFDAATGQPMGALTEEQNRENGFTREEQDRFAATSHRRAAAAWDAGIFAEEVIPVSVPQRKGEPIVVSRDETVRGDTSEEALARLRPAFAKDGTITAGTSSPISDGACALVIMSREKAEELGLEWIAEIGAHGVAAGPDSSLQLQPANASRAALVKQGLTPEEVDLWEFNEAFSVVGLASARDLDLDLERVNVNGGAIAIGHPIGVSGARLVLHLALELRRRGGGTGVAALCGGGGQGDALIIQVPSGK